MKFTKMQGCGNDYVYVDCFKEEVAEPAELARRIADRHFGVGGDGLILIEPSDRADSFMHMFNQDGSEGRMCGNGIRCVAKYIYDHGLVPSSRSWVTIDTSAGVREVGLSVADGKVWEASVDMGRPVLTSTLPEPITVLDMDLFFIGVDVGNPHAVYFLEDNPALGTRVAELPLMIWGREFEGHKRFPGSVNTEFIEILSPGEVQFRVWERGSGETLACGTGATAAAFAGMTAGKLKDEVLVHLAGGDLKIRRDANGHCFMTGPAVEVFSGEWGD